MKFFLLKLAAAAQSAVLPEILNRSTGNIQEVKIRIIGTNENRRTTPKKRSGGADGEGWEEARMRAGGLLQELIPRYGIALLNACFLRSL